MFCQDADRHHRNPEVITDSPTTRPSERPWVGEALLCERMMSFVIYDRTL